MLSFQLNIELFIEPAKKEITFVRVEYFSKFFSTIPISSSESFYDETQTIDVNFHFRSNKKLFKNELIDKIKEHIIAGANPVSDETTAQELAVKITDFIEKNHPDALKKSLNTLVKNVYNIASSFLSDTFDYIRSFQFKNLYIPRRYFASTSYREILFRLTVGGFSALSVFGLASVVGAGVLYSSAAAIASSLLGYTGFAYSLQVMFYGESIAQFNINQETKSSYRSGNTVAGGTSNTPYLRTLAGVEQDLSYLLKDRYYESNSPEGLAIKNNLKLLSRYHAFQAAMIYPGNFYANERPEQTDFIDLEEQVRSKLPNYLPN